jgi:hypothetical protein
LEAAADEDNEQLQDLWARLLAAAMGPNRRDAMRQSFIAVVKQMDPIDVLVLKAIFEHGVPWQQAANVAIASQLKCPTDEVTVSIEHLGELACVSPAMDQPRMKPFGNLLMNPVSG